MSGLIETTRFISAVLVWLAPNVCNRLCLSDDVLQLCNLSVNTLCHVIQHITTTQSTCVGPAFTFKQLLHTQWSFNRRKPRLSKFTEAHWAHRHTGNGKRFHRHGHMTRAGSVDGSGKTGGERLEWCVSAAWVVYSSMRHTKPSLFILYSSCELLLQMLSVVPPPAPPTPYASCILIGCSCHRVQSLFRQLEIEGATWTSRVAPPALITL